MEQEETSLKATKGNRDTERDKAVTCDRFLVT